MRFIGKVTGEEYQQFLDAIGERLNTGDKVSLVVELSGFKFYGDFEASRKDFKFAFNEYKHIHRASFVGDQKWISWFVRLVDPFTRAEEKHFLEGQVEAACDWACS